MATSLVLIVPWAIVLAAVLRVAFTSDVPIARSSDVVEMHDLTSALDAFAAKYGGYPPDFTSGDPRSEIDEYLSKNFPERNAQLDIPKNVGDLGPDNSLSFWLRGLCDNNPEFPLTGLVPAARRPFTNQQVKDEIYKNDYIALLISEGAEPGNGLEQTDAYRELLAGYDNLRRQQFDELAKLRERVPWHEFEWKRLSSRDAYPIVLRLRHQEDGLILLERDIRRQCRASEPSAEWQQRLDRQKQSRRDQALFRFSGTAAASERQVDAQ